MSNAQPHPMLMARRISTAIMSARIALTSEAAAHRSVEGALEAAGIPYSSEVRLSRGDRIDIMCGDVGVEIKVGHSRRDIWRQLRRYAVHDSIKALVLATGTAFPKGIGEVDGTPLIVVDLTRGWL